MTAAPTTLPSTSTFVEADQYAAVRDYLQRTAAAMAARERDACVDAPWVSLPLLPPVQE